MTVTLSGVRARVVISVVAVTACLYSLLATIGFVQIAHGGRDAIRDRIGVVLDQLESSARSGTGGVSLSTPDGVEAVIQADGTAVAATPGDVTVQRRITIGATSVTLVGRASEARLTDSLRSLYRGLWLGIPLAVLLTGAMAWFAIRRALRPVSEITALAATIGSGDEGRVPVRETGDEIEQLAHTVNDMLDRISAGRLAQRQFTSDAAHELRTPLMALQGEIELRARSDGSADSDDRGFLDRIATLAARLGSRVDDLVLLSTLDEQPPVRREATDLLDLVRNEAGAISPTIEVASAAGSAPAGSAAGRGTIVAVDAALVTRAVRNLLANAVRHRVERTVVTVEPAAGRVWIHVDDDGPGIPPGDRTQVTRRFARLDEARDRDRGGSGLGLAIAASVAAAHGGGIVVDDAPIGGARVSLWLPVT